MIRMTQVATHLSIYPLSKHLFVLYDSVDKIMTLFDFHKIIIC